MMYGGDMGGMGLLPMMMRRQGGGFAPQGVRGQFQTGDMATPPPVAYPAPTQPMPAPTPGPDVQYPGGFQNFWSNNGRTFNIPGAQALAQRGPMPGPGPMVGSDWRDTAFPTGGEADPKKKKDWWGTLNALDPGGIGGALHATSTLFDLF